MQYKKKESITTWGNERKHEMKNTHTFTQTSTHTHKIDNEKKNITTQRTTA